MLVGALLQGREHRSLAPLLLVPGFRGRVWAVAFYNSPAASRVIFYTEHVEQCPTPP